MFFWVVGGVLGGWVGIITNVALDFSNLIFTCTSCSAADVFSHLDFSNLVFTRTSCSAADVFSHLDFSTVLMLR